MLDFDDLLAARIVSKLQPGLRGALLLLLADVRDMALHQDILTILMTRNILTQDQVREVHVAMARYKRSRALGIYVQLLVREQGLERAALEAQARALGPSVAVNQLGETLVTSGQLSKEREAELRFQARVVFDSDLQRQLGEHLATSPVASARPDALPGRGIESARFNLMAQLPQVGSAVFKLDAMVPVPSQEESQEILESSSPNSFGGALRPPSFPIPDWVDTSIVGEGRFLIGDYRLLGRVGSGAMATVYLVHKLTDHERAVALKVLHKPSPPQTVARFKQEALAASLFDHPKVLDVYEAGEDQGEHYLAMEFFDGFTLERILAERMRLRPDTALRLTRQLLLALGAAHRAHVIHRDVKPANLLVSHDLRQLRLTDFGIARIDSVGGLEDRMVRTAPGQYLGTARYCSPEQAAGIPVLPASDLYSVGLVLYEMLSGSSPFEAEGMGFLSCHMQEQPRPLVEAAPHLRERRSLLELVGLLLRKSVSERPPTAAAVVEVVDVLLLGE